MSKSSAISAYRPAPRHARRRSDSIYSKRPEEPKTGCRREPTEPLALSSSVRRDLEHFARHRPLRRPSQPKQHWDFHQPERRLTPRRAGDIAPIRKKGCLNFLYVTPGKCPAENHQLLQLPVCPSSEHNLIGDSTRQCPGGEQLRRYSSVTVCRGVCLTDQRRHKHERE